MKIFRSRSDLRASPENNSVQSSIEWPSIPAISRRSGADLNKASIEAQLHRSFRQEQPRQDDLVVQPKLTLGPVGDRFEQEAEFVAAQVMRRTSSLPPAPQDEEESMTEPTPEGTGPEKRLKPKGAPSAGKGARKLVLQTKSQGQPGEPAWRGVEEQRANQGARRQPVSDMLPTTTTPIQRYFLGSALNVTSGDLPDDARSR